MSDPVLARTDGAAGIGPMAGMALRTGLIDGMPGLHHWPVFSIGGILAVMTPSAARRRHFASSPFQSDPEQVIEQFECGDRVSHDAYGMGRVVCREAEAVTVDFGTTTVRITSPFHKMTKL